MRKKLVLGLMAAMLVMSPIRILADSATPEPETEQIDDEETPRAARRNQDSALLFAFLGAGIVVIAAAWKTKNQNLSLFVNQVDSNGDGSYTVTWGYKNPKHSKIKYDKDEAGLKIKRGTAIVLKKAEPTEFEPGIHKDAIIRKRFVKTECAFYLQTFYEQLTSCLDGGFIRTLRRCEYRF